MSQDDSSPLTRDIAPFGVRMPPDLKERVATAAKSNNRSMNAEIVATLEKAYPAPRTHEDQLRFVMSLIDDFGHRPTDSPEGRLSQLRFLYTIMMNIAGKIEDSAYDKITEGWQQPLEFDDPDFIISCIDPEIRPSPPDAPEE